MKRKILFILSIMLALFYFGCVKKPPKAVDIPPEDIVFSSECGPLLMEKGFLNEENHHDSWMLKNEFDEYLEKLLLNKDGT